jgi:hypothetical protein
VKLGYHIFAIAKYMLAPSAINRILTIILGIVMETEATTIDLPFSVVVSSENIFPIGR